jgi:Chaperone for flagella basal body P-ring formation
MSYRHCYPSRYRLFWSSMLCVAGLASARAACYSSPTAAVESMRPGSSQAPLTAGGYWVTSIQTDPMSGQRWAMIASCDHPERPVFSLQTEQAGAAQQLQLSEPQMMPDNAHATPLVHVGDTVRLWRQEAVLRIEMAGVAEENGGLGKLIRVRLLRRGTEDQSTRAEFAGVVRGRADVEMQP